MILLSLIFLLNPYPQDTIPYKPKPDFDLIINYELKDPREKIDAGANDRFRPVYWSKTTGNTSPYFSADLKVKTLSGDEVRYRIVDSAGKPVTSQKVKAGNTIHLTLGFIEDIKNGVVPNGYKIIFVTKKKVDISQIEIRVLEDGAFVVNGEYHLFLPHGF